MLLQELTSKYLIQLMVQSMIVMSCSQSSWTHFRMMKRKHLAISRDFMLLWARQSGEVELNHQKLTINFYGSFTEAVGMISLFLNSILILIKMTLLKYKTYCVPSEPEKTRVHRIFCALVCVSKQNPHPSPIPASAGCCLRQMNYRSKLLSWRNS